MSNKRKPEWFEITENDQIIPTQKANRSLPRTAVFVAMLILGVGAVVGQTNEDSPANATNAVLALGSPSSPVKVSQSTSTAPSTLASSTMKDSDLKAFPSGEDDEYGDEFQEHGYEGDDD